MLLTEVQVKCFSEIILGAAEWEEDVSRDEDVKETLFKFIFGRLSPLCKFVSQTLGLTVLEMEHILH